MALGRGIAVEPDIVFDKLVTRRRGGYCFEHNTLFLAALDALGFAARPLLARVWLGVSTPQPLVHALALVTFADGAEWIADAGFGAAYAPPLPLLDGAEATAADGTRHTLARDAEHGWMLYRAGPAAATDGRGADADAAGAAGLPQISFTTARAWPADLALGNHWASQAPASRFVQHRVASIVLPDGFASLVDRRYDRASAAGHATEEIASADEYRRHLARDFGIALTPDEVAALGLFDAPTAAPPS